MHNGWFNFFRFLNAVPFPPAARLVVRKPLCFFGGIGLVLFCLRFFSAPLLFSEVRSPPAGRREESKRRSACPPLGSKYSVCMPPR